MQALEVEQPVVELLAGLLVDVLANLRQHTDVISNPLHAFYAFQN